MSGDDRTDGRVSDTRWLLVLLAIAGAALLIRWDHNRRGRYFWQPAPAEAPAAAPAPAPETKK